MQHALKASHRVTAKPDCAVVELNGDPAITAHAPPLTGNIRMRLQDAISAHESRDAPIAATAHRILRDPVARREGAHLEIGIRPSEVETENIDPGDADRVQRRACPCRAKAL